MATLLPVRVLFVEDSADDVELVVRTLQEGGFSVDWTRVDDAQGFRAALESDGWDVILCDFAMRHFDPHQALAMLRERGVDIPLLVVSGIIPERTAVALMKEGARDYVLKDSLPRLVPAMTRELRDAIARREGRDAHRLMRQSESFFRTVIEHVSDVIAVTDLNGTVLHIAPSVERVVGRNPEDLVGTFFLDLIVAADRDASAAKLRALGAGPGVRVVSEVRFAHADGSERLLECAATSFVTPAGDAAIVINARDVTERRAQERQLRETSSRLTLLNAVARAAHFGAPAATIIRGTIEQLAAAFPGMHAAYSTADEDNVLTVQDAAGAADGARPEGRAIDLSTLADALGRLDRGEVFAADNVTAGSRVAALAPAGATDVGAFAIAPMRDLGRLKGGLSLASRDPHRWTPYELTSLAEVAAYLSLALNEEAAQRERLEAESALQQSEARLRQAQKMEAIGRLAGGIAHDFNNLLMAILGYGEMVAEQIGDHPAAGDVEQILEAGRRAAALTRQLLAFSRQQTLAPEILCPNDVVRDMAQLLGRLLGQDVELQLDLQEDVADIKVDRGQLEQVLMNLAVNSRDAMPEGGTLRIVTRASTLNAETAAAAGTTPGSHVLVEVADSGAGMDAATMARIFEPFFTTKEKGQGTGLGLATVYGIVTQSGGGVDVESTPGRGTVFRVYFPAMPRTSPARVADVEPSAG